MPTINRFEELEIWQEARRLSNRIEKIARETALCTDYKLRDQIRASIGSSMDNIAEGFERAGNGEFKQFLAIAKGLSGEARSQLYRIFDFGYIAETDFLQLKTELEHLSGKINNFINYLNKTTFKGRKFQ